jgi:hypothetical protein
MPSIAQSKALTTEARHEVSRNAMNNANVVRAESEGKTESAGPFCNIPTIKLNLKLKLKRRNVRYWNAPRVLGGSSGL